MKTSNYFKTGIPRAYSSKTGLKALTKFCFFVLCFCFLSSSAEAGRVSKILNKDEYKLKQMIKKAQLNDLTTTDHPLLGSANKQRNSL